MLSLHISYENAKLSLFGVRSHVPFQARHPLDRIGSHVTCLAGRPLDGITLPLLSVIQDKAG